MKARACHAHLVGGEGDDYCRHQEGSDGCFGGPGNDTCDMGGGSDGCHGGPGNDRLLGGGDPDQLYGDGLVAACAAAGTDCLDLTGEPNWMRTVIDAHSETAKKTGARIVHSWP